MSKTEKHSIPTQTTESNQSNQSIDQWKKDRIEKQRLLILSKMSTQDRVRNLLK